MNYRNSLAAALLGSASMNGYALEPVDIDLAGFNFTPTLKVTEMYDDNFRALENSEKQSSWITSIKPKFLLEADTRKSGYQLEYSFDNQTYHEASAANHTDHALAFRSVLEFDSRNRLHYDLGYQRLEQTTDTTDRSENDKLTVKNAGIGYTFGSFQARNQIDADLKYEERRYLNADGINDDMERNTTALTSTWYHRLTGKTRALAELRYTDFDYLQSGNPRNSVGTAALVGLAWEATALTTGTVRLGQERKNYDDNDRDDSSPTWEVGIDWKPLSYSTVSLSTRKAYDEGDDDAIAIHQQRTRLGWKHEWTPRITTDLNATHADRDYQGIDREDRRNIYGVGTTYAMRRWLDITASYAHTQNDSSLSSETYTRNLYLLSFEFSL